MEAGKALGGEEAQQAEGRRAASSGWSRTLGLLNPLRAVWWLFTNVRFAIVLLVALALVSLLGVLLPQVPLNVRGDAVAEADWLKFQEGKFGVLTTPIDRAGLFDLFHASWFAALLAITMASTGAYILSRAPGIWVAITRPRKRVPDRYFQMAPNRFQTSTSVDVEKLERLLRKQRYRVERVQEQGATYLFADRFQWAQLGTLLTHAAVIVFILSAVVSRVDAYSSDLFLAEGSTLPVFAVRDPNQMQVQLLDASAAFTADGQPLDYRSEIAIFRRGEEVSRCESTVNSPCSYEGYRFYQAAYFGFGAAVQVRDLGTGNVIYRETLALSGKTPSPHVMIRDSSGRPLLDEYLVLTDQLSTQEFTYSGTLVRLPDGRPLAVGLQTAAGQRALTVFEPAQGVDAVRLRLAEGESGEAGGLNISYMKEGMVPSALIPDFPLPPAAQASATDGALLQLSNVTYGTETASEGTPVESAGSAGPPRLTLVGLQPQAVTLAPGQSESIGGYEYTFLGQREFSGLQVKRDRSDYLVWIGAGLIVLGLMVTFWVPRRRLWAKITAAETFLAGQAASHANYTRELRRLARQAGASEREDVEDDD